MVPVGSGYLCSSFLPSQIANSVNVGTISFFSFYLPQKEPVGKRLATGRSKEHKKQKARAGHNGKDSRDKEAISQL